jgi:uncharacterized protein (TIGR02300 family)
VGRPAFGTRCTCTSRTEHFYDLNRSPAVCPKCGAAQSHVVAYAPRPARTKFVDTRMMRPPMPVTSEEEPEFLDAVEDDADVPEIAADEDADVDPVLLRD